MTCAPTHLDVHSTSSPSPCVLFLCSVLFSLFCSLSLSLSCCFCLFVCCELLCSVCGFLLCCFLLFACCPCTVLICFRRVCMWRDWAERWGFVSCIDDRTSKARNEGEEEEEEGKKKKSQQVLKIHQNNPSSNNHDRAVMYGVHVGMESKHEWQERCTTTEGRKGEEVEEGRKKKLRKEKKGTETASWLRG